MEGHIWVDGAAGGGATFHVTLPKAEPVWNGSVLVRSS